MAIEGIQGFGSGLAQGFRFVDDLYARRRRDQMLDRQLELAERRHDLAVNEDIRQQTRLGMDEQDHAHKQKLQSQAAIGNALAPIVAKYGTDFSSDEAQLAAMRALEAVQKTGFNPENIVSDNVGNQVVVGSGTRPDGSTFSNLPMTQSGTPLAAGGEPIITQPEDRINYISQFLQFVPGYTQQLSTERQREENAAALQRTHGLLTNEAALSTAASPAAVANEAAPSPQKTNPLRESGGYFSYPIPARNLTRKIAGDANDTMTQLLTNPDTENPANYVTEYIGNYASLKDDVRGKSAPVMIPALKAKREELAATLEISRAAYVDKYDADPTRGKDALASGTAVDRAAKAATNLFANNTLTPNQNRQRILAANEIRTIEQEIADLDKVATEAMRDMNKVAQAAGIKGSAPVGDNAPNQAVIAQTASVPFGASSNPVNRVKGAMTRVNRVVQRPNKRFTRQNYNDFALLKQEGLLTQENVQNLLQRGRLDDGQVEFEPFDPTKAHIIRDANGQILGFRPPLLADVLTGAQQTRLAAAKRQLSESSQAVVRDYFEGYALRAKEEDRIPDDRSVESFARELEHQFYFSGFNERNVLRQHGFEIEDLTQASRIELDAVLEYFTRMDTSRRAWNDQWWITRKVKAAFGFGPPSGMMSDRAPDSQRALDPSQIDVPLESIAIARDRLRRANDPRAETASDHEIIRMIQDSKYRAEVEAAARR